MAEPMKPPLILLAEDSLVPWCCATAVLDSPNGHAEHRQTCEWNQERDQIRNGQPVAVRASHVIDPSRWPGGPDYD